MKSFSDHAVSKVELEAIDAKQSAQIKQLRFALAASVIFNLIVAIALKFY